MHDVGFSRVCTDYKFIMSRDSSLYIPNLTASSKSDTGFLFEHSLTSLAAHCVTNTGTEGKSGSPYDVQPFEIACPALGSEECSRGTGR